MTGRETKMVPPIFLQPFNLLCQRYDFQLTVRLKDHPEYESIEALVMDRPGETPLIRVLIHLRDQSRVEHLNDEGLIRAHQASGRTQKAVYSPFFLPWKR